MQLSSGGSGSQYSARFGCSTIEGGRSARPNEQPGGQQQRDQRWGSSFAAGDRRILMLFCTDEGFSSAASLAAQNCCGLWNMRSDCMLHDSFNCSSQLAQLACMTPYMSTACMVLTSPALPSPVSSLLQITLLILSKSLF